MQVVKMNGEFINNVMNDIGRTKWDKYHNTTAREAKFNITENNGEERIICAYHFPEIFGLAFDVAKGRKFLKND